MDLNDYKKIEATLANVVNKFFSPEIEIAKVRLQEITQQIEQLIGRCEDHSSLIREYQKALLEVDILLNPISSSFAGYSTNLQNEEEALSNFLSFHCQREDLSIRAEYCRNIYDKISDLLGENRILIKEFSELYKKINTANIKVFFHLGYILKNVD